MTGDNLVEAFNIKVKGKKKNSKKKKGTTANEQQACWRYLYLWRDDAFPDIDSKRHLLVFLYSISWKGGYIFPSQDEINNPPIDGIYETYIKEDELYSTLKMLYNDVLKRNDKLGAHTTRKSAYLFGAMGGGEIATMMMAADHDCYHVAARYAQDAVSVMEVNNVFQDRNQAVGPWRSPYCAGNETAARSTAPGAKFQKPLNQIITGFIEEIVGISPNDPKRLHPKYICEKVVNWIKPRDPFASLQQHLNDISKDKTRAIMGCVHELQNAAMTKFAREATKKAKDEAKQEFLLLVARLKGHISLQGLNSDELDRLNIDSFLQDALGDQPVPPVVMPEADVSETVCYHLDKRKCWWGSTRLYQQRSAVFDSCEQDKKMFC